MWDKNIVASKTPIVMLKLTAILVFPELLRLHYALEN